MGPGVHGGKRLSFGQIVGHVKAPRSPKCRNGRRVAVRHLAELEDIDWIPLDLAGKLSSSISGRRGRLEAANTGARRGRPSNHGRPPARLRSVVDRGVLGPKIV